MHLFIYKRNILDLMYIRSTHAIAQWFSRYNSYKIALLILQHAFNSGRSFDRHLGLPKIIIKRIINVRPKAAQIFLRPFKDAIGGLKNI